ncbi:MAG: ATP-grasp domain-containing protein [Cyanobacteriota bacterium]|nr:ATP-grasp domain-containing protein [Cyanobacteriota bacterium]
MDLLEYQAKELFREVGIPILPSEYIDDPRQVRRLQLPYPLVLKSQVRAVERAKAGGIRFVENTIDAIAAARAIFSLPILGEYPRVLLAETRYEAEQELFLAIALDYQLQRPVLLGSVADNLRKKSQQDRLEQVVVEEEFSPFYARRLAIAMGLERGMVESVSAVLAKMYHLFVTKDLNRIEINPLGVNPLGEVMALDGKITVNDEALGRHPDLLAFTASEYAVPEQQFALNTIECRPCWIDEGGEIGVLCNGIGLGMTTWDLLVQEKGKPACLWAIATETGGTLLSTEEWLNAFEQGLAQLAARPQIKVILIHILCRSTAAERLACAISDAISTENGLTPSGKFRLQPMPPLVACLVGGDLDAIQSQFDELPVSWTNRLDAAVQSAIAFC